jgi:hypothetical protein
LRIRSRFCVRLDGPARGSPALGGGPPGGRKVRPALRPSLGDPLLARLGGGCRIDLGPFT